MLPFSPFSTEQPKWSLLRVVCLSPTCFKLQSLFSYFRKKTKLNNMGCNSPCWHPDSLIITPILWTICSPCSYPHPSVPAVLSVQYALPVLLPPLDKPSESSWSGYGAPPTDSCGILHKFYHSLWCSLVVMAVSLSMSPFRLYIPWVLHLLMSLQHLCMA